MDPTADKSAEHAPFWTLSRSLLWLAATIVVATVAGGKIWIVHTYANEVAQQARLDQDGSAAIAPIVAAVNLLGRNQASEQVFKQQFAIYNPHEARVRRINPTTTEHSLNFAVPDGYSFNAVFKNNRMWMWEYSREKFPPIDTHWWDIFRQYAARLTDVGIMVWLALLTFAMTNRRNRRILSEAMFAISIVCGLTWAADHSRIAFVQFEARRVSLWINAGMTILSIGILLWSYRRPALDGRCRSCNYDLTENISGICPECGSTIPPRRWKPNFDVIAENLSAIE